MPSQRTATGTLDGRAVELRLISIFDGMAANKTAQETGDHVRAGFVMLAASAHWADSGEKIFADVDAVGAWPMFQFGEIVELSAACQRLNNPKTDVPDDKPAANGHDADEARPSL